MDIEKQRRIELIQSLGSGFHFFEEVRLRHAMFEGRIIRADVLAVPVEGKFAGVPLAFEVKEPTPEQQSKFWVKALRQAADYVYAKIEPPVRKCEGLPVGGRIAAAFIFPAPATTDYDLQDRKDVLIGARALALHFRVGQARPSVRGKGRFALAFAGNEIWQSDCGFKEVAGQFIGGGYRLGSKIINAIEELDVRS